MSNTECDLLTPRSLAAIVGVIDIRGGLAVHAIAGKRSEYRPVAIAPDPDSLLRVYAKLGLQNFYLADLDAIVDGQPQTELIDGLIDRWHGNCSELIIDVGYRGHGLKLNLAANVGVVAATETATSLDTLNQLVRVVPASQVVLGLDYRDGDFVGPQGTTDQQWLTHASALGVQRTLALDVATVGTSSSKSSQELCRRVKQFGAGASQTLYSGGGIRNAADLQAMFDVGCKKCLVATSLLKFAKRAND